MNTVTLPTFEGKLLIPKTVPETDFLRGDFGRAVLEECQGRAKADFQGNRHLLVLSYNPEKDVVEGSNAFVVALMNHGALSNNRA